MIGANCTVPTVGILNTLTGALLIMNLLPEYRMERTFFHSPARGAQDRLKRRPHTEGGGVMVRRVVDYSRSWRLSHCGLLWAMKLEA